MKTPMEWWSVYPEPGDTVDDMKENQPSCLRFIEKVQADAREQGRREGLEEAAQACLGHETDPASWQNNVWDSARKACADAIRKLAEKSGGAMGAAEPVKMGVAPNPGKGTES